MATNLKILEKIEISKQDDGYVDLKVNGESIDTKNNTYIRLEIKHDSDGTTVEVMAENRVCLLNYPEESN